MTRGQIYRKANRNGYIIRFGKQHYLRGRERADGKRVFPVCYDENGNPYTGYTVKDTSTGAMVWGCYNKVHDHAWNWEDVTAFVEGLPE